MLRQDATAVTLVARHRMVRDERWKFILNLKPAPVGDRRTFVSLRLAAEKEGLSMFIGGMLETGIGITVVLPAALGLGVGAVIMSQTLFAITNDHLANYAALAALGRRRLRSLVA